MFLITDFNTDQLAGILKKIRKEDSVSSFETKHCRKRFIERSKECNRKTVYNLLKTLVPEGNNKTSSNTFKVIYEHPNLENIDIYIIIAILIMESIKLITVYVHSSFRRKR